MPAIEQATSRPVAPSGDTVAADLARLREISGQVTGSVFFGKLLAQSRESSLKGPYGHGGRGEEVFAAQLHGLLAERAGTASGNNIAEQLYRRLEHQQSLISRTKPAAGNLGMINGQ